MISFCEILSGLVLLLFVFLSIFAIRRWPNPKQQHAEEVELLLKYDNSDLPLTTPSSSVMTEKEYIYS